MIDSITLLFSTEDPQVDDLVAELVSNDVSRERSEAILKELKPLTLSDFQKKQILDSIRHHWNMAVTQAKQAGVSLDRPTKGSVVDQIFPVYQIHAGLKFDRS